MSPIDPNHDAWVDSQLRDVPVPEGLLERLAHIPGPSDEDIDEALSEVPLPRGFLRRLERWAEPSTRRFQYDRLLLAASLLMALWLIYGIAIAGFLVSLSESPDSPPPVSLAAKRVRETEIATALPAPTLFGAILGCVQVRSSDGRKELAAFDPAQGPPEIDPPSPLGPEPSPLAEMQDLLCGSQNRKPIDWLSDAHMVRWKDVLASHAAFDDLPELQKVVGGARRGVAPPPVPGYNVAVLSRWGVHPFVVPALDTRLQASNVPLAVDAASWELTRRYLEDGELPSPEAIRAEDFLAAVDYRFPRPASEPVGLHAFGGPTPFRADGRQLLQFGVQAAAAAEVRHSPIRVTLALDVSSSMRWEGRLEMARRAIEMLLRRLGPEDRISLVIFSEEARVLFEDLSVADHDRIAGVLRLLSPLNSTNLGAGLGQAYAVAERAKAPPTRHRVILLTDGLFELDRSTVYRIEHLLSEAAAEGIHFDVIDLAQKRARKSDPCCRDSLRPAEARSTVRSTSSKCTGRFSKV